ncbi:MAG TPA: formate dehydrogenase subunit gamma, partial [Hyphomicrobiaceae bacterium]
FRNSAVFYGGAIYIFGLSLLIAIFLAWRGRIRIAEGESGETVRRFNVVERANHWLTATSFLLLAITGLIILYGLSVIRPWLGADPYDDVAGFSAWSHVALAVPFVLGVLVMIFLWTRENLPERLDWNWMRQFGGFLNDSAEKPPARRFNAGQKLVFWSVALSGIVLLVTGLFLMFPFDWAGYTGMQAAQVVHAVVALLMVGVIIGHIYIGTVGMQGAFEAMWSGRVDRNWAKEHHQLWYDRIESGADREAARAAPRSRFSPAAGLATGAVVAVVLALIMSAVYSDVGVGSAVATSRDNPAVHLGQADLNASSRAFMERMR